MDKTSSPSDPGQSLEVFAREKLDDLEARSLRRWLAETDRGEGVSAVRRGRDLISFCCNDYLSLSHHPKLRRAAIDAIERYGVGAGASRLVTGNHPLYGDLETRLARLKGTEAACVFGSGYLANTGIIPSLMGAGDLIVLDELSHACMHAGSRLSRATIAPFAHNDTGDCRRIFEAERGKYRRCLLLTEGVFSMDGDLAPLPELSDLARDFDAWLMTDDAHGLGVIGGGRGSRAHWQGRAEVLLQMGTLSKAVGAYGGYLCASQPVIDLIRNRARSFIYTTGLPPAVVAAASAGVDIIERDPDLTALPVKKARLFTSLMNLPQAESCIVPVILGAAEKALAASEALFEAGFLVTAIRPPTVPDGTARLRFTFCAGHDDADIERLATCLRGQGLVGAETAP
jgi:8-amino-7-oxononanoate synthase